MSAHESASSLLNGTWKRVKIVDDIYMVIGNINVSEYAITNTYGNSYWASFDFDIPLEVACVDWYAASVNVWGESNDGTAYAMLNNLKKGQVSGFVINSLSEVKNYALSFIGFGVL